MHPLIKNIKQNGVLNYLRILLSISIILSTFNPIILASAASGGIVAISSEKVNPGDNAHVVISIANCENVTGINLTLVYDPSIMSIDSVLENHSAVLGHVADYVEGTPGTAHIQLRQLNNTTTVADIPLLDLVFTTSVSGRSSLVLQDVEILSANTSSVPDTIINGTINVNSAPVLGAIGNQDVNESETLILILDATDIDGDTLTYSSNASFGTLTGNAFTWTPGFDDSGTYSINFSVSDGNGIDSEIITVTVSNTNRAPVFTSLSDEITEEGIPFSLVLTANDPDGDTLAYFKDVPYGNISGNVFTWTPDYDDKGFHQIEFSVTDGSMWDYDIVTIGVGSTNLMPVLEPIDNQLVNESETLDFILNASSPDYDPIEYTASDLPSGATLDPTTGEFSWTPDYEQSGIYTITFRAYDGVFEDLEQMTIEVINVNRPPSFGQMPVHYVNEDEELTITLNCMDPDTEDLLTFSSNTSYGLISGDKFSWTPGYTANQTSNGIYNINFTATDGELSDFAVVTVVVSDTNAPPELSFIGSRSVEAEQELEINLVATDMDGDSLAYLGQNLPDNAFLDEVTGVFSWIPDSDDVGTHTINFTVSDGNATDSETITITVLDVIVPNNAPVLDLIGDRILNESETLTITLNATDIDGDTLTYFSNASFGTLNDNVFNWIPNSDDIGSHTVKFTVSDGTTIDSETITITVLDVVIPNNAPVLDFIGERVVNESETLKITLNATDIDGDTLTYSSNAGFGTLNGKVFSWTPTYDDSNIYDVEFNVSDGIDVDHEVITITVLNVNRPPVLANIGDRSVMENSMLTINLSATDADNDTLKYFTDAAFGSMDDNVFTWIPTYDNSGTYDVNFTVSDGKSYDEKAITIKVNNVNREPVLIDVGSNSVKEGETLEFSLSASDQDNDALSYTMDDIPATASLNSTTGAFSWTPGYDDEGYYTVRFAVSDGSDEDVTYAEITVEKTNRAPEFPEFETVNVAENDTLILDISAFDPDDDFLTYFDNVSFGAISDDTFTWIPNFTDSGTHYVEFTVSDGYLVDSAIVTIVVANTNRAPVFTSLSDEITEEGIPFSLVLNANDPDGDALAYFKDVPYGNISGNVFSWTPDYDDKGFHQIEFSVTDGSMWDYDIVTIGVGNTNLMPVLEPIDNQLVNESETLDFTLNASSPDYDPIEYTASDLPFGATLDPTTGEFSWTPDYEQSGIYTITFRAYDGVFEDLEQMTIEVINVNRPPSFGQMPVYNANEGEELTIILNCIDPDNEDSLTFLSNVSFGSISGNEFIWTPGYTANQTSNGTYNINFTATDGELSDFAVVTVIVSDTNAPPELSSIGSKSVEEAHKLEFNLIATDVDGDVLAYSAQNLPENSVLDELTGVFSWTPSVGDAGTYSVIFKVSDNELNVTETVDITVSATSSSSSTISSSGGGGGGGGGSAGTGEEFENIDFKDYVLKSVVKDTDTVFAFYGKNNSIVSVSITSVLNAGQVKSVVEVLKDTSSQVDSRAPGQVYKNMNILLDDKKLTEATINNAKVEFKVDKKWLDDNEVDVSTITLCRYSDDSWEQLPTEIKDDDDSYFYFTSTTPGFSSFAISSIKPMTTGAYISEDVTPVSTDDESTFMSTSTDDSGSVESTTGASQESRSVFLIILVLVPPGLMIIGVFGYRNRGYYDKLRKQIGNHDGKRYRRNQ